MSLRALSAGTQLGKCIVGVLMGRGGMGAVYRGWHRTLQVDVAIKVIGGSQQGGEDAELRGRFLREARAAARLRHENLVQVLDVDEHEGFLYMVTEYVDGGSVAHRLRLGPLAWREAARIGAEVARGLAVAHEAGIVHRDIKPANLLLTEDGVVKVADFGLAAWREDGREITRHGQLLGTPYYMAPEQIECREISGRADLYALGATLFHAVTGQVPFPGDSSLQVCMRHLTDPVPSARAANEDLPPAFEALIRWLLEKAPRDRPQSAEEAARHLERLARGDTAMPERPARAADTPALSDTLAPSCTSPSPTALPPGSAAPWSAASDAIPVGTPPRRPARWAIPAAVLLLVVVVLGLRAGGILRFGAVHAPRPDPRSVAPPPRPSGTAARHPAHDPATLDDPLRAVAKEASVLEAAGEFDRALRLYRDAAELASHATTRPASSMAVAAYEQAIGLCDRLGRYQEGLALAKAQERRFGGSSTLRAWTSDAERAARLCRLARLAGRRLAAPLQLVGRQVPSGTTHLAVRDLDGDGSADVATCGGRVLLFRGSSRGLMAESRLGDLDTDRYRRLLGVVDLERPDQPILVLQPKAGARGRHALDLVRPYHQANHLLLAARTVTTTDASFPDGAPQVLSADLDGDETRELVFWSERRAAVDLWYGAPAFPTSARSRVVLPGRALAVAVATRSGAGRADLVLVLAEHAAPGRNEPTAVVLSIGGPRTRLQKTTVARGRWDWPRLACGDWSGDGRTDLLANAGARGAVRGQLAPFRSTLAGTLQEIAGVPPVEVQPAMPWLCLGDLDQDGRADVVLIARRGSVDTLHTLRSRGDGTFQGLWRAQVDGLEVLTQMTTGDLDGNGNADLVLFDRPDEQVLAIYGDGRGGFQLRPE